MSAEVINVVESTSDDSESGSTTSARSSVNPQNAEESSLDEDYFVGKSYTDNDYTCCPVSNLIVLTVLLS